MRIRPRQLGKNMHITTNIDILSSRASQSDIHKRDGMAPGVQDGIIAAAVVGGLLLSLFMTWFTMRQLRKRHANPKYIPGKYLKQRWRQWNPQPLSGHKHSTLLDRMDERETTQSADCSTPVNRRETTSALTQQERVDRHTSIRSIATLPVYSSVPHPEEETVAREGERGGIDTVIEFPETLDEEESRREDEMESLYQIRRARREERAQREERRARRREARDRGDLLALEEIRRQRREAAASPSGTSAADMMREHQARDRTRRVSSVSYADLGVARHDGTRMRADSNDSDQRPLLDSAARPGMRSRAGSSAMSLHFRNQSSLSVATRILTPDISDDEEGRGSGDEDAGAWESPRPSTAAGAQSLHSQSTRGQDTGSGDIASNAIPPPPEYESMGWPTIEEGEMAPPYESPTRLEAPQIGNLSPLPSIQIDPGSPILPHEPENTQLEAATTAQETGRDGAHNP